MIHLKRSDSEILANPSGPRAACGAETEGDTVLGLLAFGSAVADSDNICAFCWLQYNDLNAQLAAIVERHSEVTREESPVV